MTAAVDHHLPALEAAARDKVTRALQRQLRTILAASVDPGSCTCPRCKAAIVSAYHCIGRVAAICCSAWWSTTGSLPDKPKLLAAGLWSAPLWGDYAAAYLGWNDASLGRRSTEDAEPSEVRKKLETALAHVHTLCKIASDACRHVPPAAAATGATKGGGSGASSGGSSPAVAATPSQAAASAAATALPLATGGVVLVGGAAGSEDPLREDYLSTGPAPPPSAAGTTAASRALPRPAGFESPRGLALVASIALLLTVLHRESLWLHARLFPAFFQTGLTTPLSASYAALMPSLAPISPATVAAIVAAGTPAAAAPAALVEGAPGAGAAALIKAASATAAAAAAVAPVPPPAVAVASAAAQAALNAVDSVSVATPPDASPTRRALAAKLEATGQGIKAAIAASEAAKVGERRRGWDEEATWVQRAPT